MSEYQDDVFELATLVDSNWLILNSLIVDNLSIIDSNSISIQFMIIDHLSVSDDISEQLVISVNENLNIIEQWFFNRVVFIEIKDGVKITDYPYLRFEDLVVESLSYIESTYLEQKFNITDTASIESFVYGQKQVNQLTVDTLKASDKGYFVFDLSAFEECETNSFVFSQIFAEIFNLESATFENTISSNVITNLVGEEKLISYSSIFSQLLAVAQVREYLFIEDEITHLFKSGQAWTATTDTWAMSRYAPFSFDGLSIIDGELYAWNDEGVFLIGVEGENIEAKVEIGKLDFGDHLTHLSSAFLEYELSGVNKEINIDVSSTQSGFKQTYNYLMPDKDSDYLTNGRIKLGKGLRGRHFSFVINMKGTSGKINALSFEHIPTARRT